MVLSTGVVWAACTEGNSQTSSLSSMAVQPTATTTPTAESSTTITSLQRTDDVVLVRVDPATLHPLPGAETITSGDWISGTMSDNGEWLVLNVWIDTEPDTDLIEVVEVSSGRVVTRFDGPLMHDLRVGDDGSVYNLFEVYKVYESGSRGWVGRLAPGQSGFEKVFDAFPDGFTRWTPMTLLGVDLAGWLGTLEDDSGQVEAALVVADFSDRSAQVFRLPGVALGHVGGQELDDWVAPEIMEPAVVWDTDRHRALVVHADQPSVTVVDFTDGRVSEHSWSPATSWIDGLLAWLIPPAQAKGPSVGAVRSAVISPSGEFLYVANRRADVVADSSGGWRVESVPQGVEVISTEDWKTVARFDIPASQVSLSPDGAYLVAAGAVKIDTISATVYELKDVHIIRTDTLELVGPVDAPGEWLPDVQFSNDGTYVYLGGSGGGRINIVELETAQMLDLVVDTPRMEMFGRAGMLSSPPRR